MWFDRVIRWLLPKEEHFYDLLEKGADSLRDAGRLIALCCRERDFKKREEIIQQIRESERRSDRIIAETYVALNDTFVTPIDRSDIYELATDMEKISDAIFGTALQIIVHAIEDLPPGSEELADLIEKACEAIYQGVCAIRVIKDPEAILGHKATLEALEHEGDRVFRERTGAMFKSEKDAVRLIKHKEFLEGLERALDDCDDVGSILGNIVINNA